MKSFIKSPTFLSKIHELRETTFLKEVHVLDALIGFKDEIYNKHTFYKALMDLLVE